ncbi:MAG: hypothetical protein IIW21_08765 [Clostridia bacterium]|nr:hypothetical protein [Clostridia bacterium]
MEKTLTPKMIIDAISKKLALILAVSILTSVLLFVYSAFFIEDKYTTSVSVLVHNAQTVNSNTSTVSDMNAADKLTAQFIEILQNPAILNQVALYVGNDPLTDSPRVTAKELEDIVFISSSGNAILKIIIRCSDAELCLDICEAMATRGAELLGEKVEASSVQRIESTKADIAEPALVSKGIVRNAVLGIFLGFILTAAPVILVAYFDDTIKSSEEITTVLGLPILGEVPSLVEDAGNTLPKEASRK